MKKSTAADKMGKLKKMLEAATKNYQSSLTSRDYRFIPRDSSTVTRRGTTISNDTYRAQAWDRTPKIVIIVTTTENGGQSMYHFEFREDDFGNASYESPDMTKDALADELEKKLQEFD